MNTLQESIPYVPAQLISIKRMAASKGKTRSARHFKATKCRTDRLYKIPNIPWFINILIIAETSRRPLVSLLTFSKNWESSTTYKTILSFHQPTRCKNTNPLPTFRMFIACGVLASSQRASGRFLPSHTTTTFVCVVLRHRRSCRRLHHQRNSLH